MKRYVLGIAGFMGSGKTTAGRYFEKKGARFIDADKVVDELYKPDQAGYLKIVNYFGDEFLTKSGLINRKKLAKFVFGDPNKLKILNYLIHPLVSNEIRKVLDRTKDKVVAIEATYFDRRNLGSLVDGILWMECANDVLRKRAAGIEGMTADKFEKIIKVQRKPEKTDFIVYGDKTMTQFKKELEKVWKKIYI